MKTPICDFIEKYTQNDNIRLHMPGHKGIGDEAFSRDITEISGADSLYSAEGIIRESESFASEIFGARTPSIPRKALPFRYARWYSF